MTQTHPQLPFAALVGIDWGDRHHAICLGPAGTQRREHSQLEQTPEALHAWAAQLRRRFRGQPVAICLEQSRGPLVHALLAHEFLVLFPVNPKQLARFREAVSSSGAKDDRPDAELLLELLTKHGDRLRAWTPDDETTRLLARLAEDRRGLVDARSALINQLQARLKEFFPQALQLLGRNLWTNLACDFLSRWPSLPQLKRARPQTVRDCYRQHHTRRERIEERLALIRQAVPLTQDQAVVESGSRLIQAVVAQIEALNHSIAEYDRRLAELLSTHQDAPVFASFPGAGAALVPRLVAAFGTDRQRFTEAAQVQNHTGIAPITRASGTQRSVQRRRACPKFLRQTFQEFASHSIGFSRWACAYYRMLRARGQQHHAAIRALAFKWIRILFRCWQDRTAYNEERYLQTLQRRNSPLLQFLEPRLDLTHQTPTA